jgi:2Fe-2S ferredoxin
MTTAVGQNHDGAIVRVEPAGIDVAVPTGIPLMKAAQAAGLRWPNVCSGQAQCGVCAIEVLAGDLATTPAGVSEGQMLSRLSQRPRQGGVMRLACQFLPTGPFTVLKLGVRAPQVPPAGE